MGLVNRIDCATGEIIQIQEPDPTPEQLALAVEESVPSRVKAYQAREALRQAGLLDAVNAFFASPAATPLMIDAWTSYADISRNSPTVASVAAALNLTSAQIDQLFIVADQIRA